MHGQTGEQPMNPKGDDSLESGTHEVPHQDQAVPHQRKSPQPVPHHQSAPFPRSTITGDLLKPLAEKVMATPTGRTATAVLPDVPWVEIMGLHMLYVAVMKLDRSIEEVAAAEIPNLVEQADAHPLHAAASTGRIDSSRCLALVSKKKSTSSGNRLKEASGDVEMDVRGFECDELDGYGKSALHWASAAGREDWVVALLRAGANPNIADQRGMTALHEAVVGKHISVVRVLVETGADVRYQERMRGRSALHFAAMFGNAKLVKILCENGAKHELRDRWDGFTPLMSAVAKGQLETTETLLDCGADPEAESIMILTPLMVASIMGYVDVAKALLRRGASACHAGIGNLTPLHLAAEKGHAGLVEHLLRAGADPKARVSNPPPRSTPLHVACRSTRLASVVSLLRGGADETMQDDTPAQFPRLDLAAGANGGGSGGDAPPLSRPPLTTPYDVVGFGKFSPFQDPGEIDGSETLQEYERRRDPYTIDLIQNALRRAPADRAWRRRSWLIMLRVVYDRMESTLTAELRSPKEESRRGEEGCKKISAVDDARAEEEHAASEREATCRDGKCQFQTAPALGGLKRARRQDAMETEEGEKGEKEGEGSAVAPVMTLSPDTEERAKAKSTGETADGLTSGTVRVSIEERISDGGISSGSNSGSDDCTQTLRRLCERLFGLADVEEGTFRRVVSFF